MSISWRGECVVLTVETNESAADAWARWDKDAQFKRLLDSDPAVMRTVAQHRRELDDEKPSDNSWTFSIHTLADDKQIGFVALWMMSWVHRDAFVAIGIGERDYQGKGYGYDAMRVLLRFAFEEVGLHRVSLNVFSVNERAIRSYERVGFKQEGRLREAMLRDGRRNDIIYMGILHEEWLRA